MSDSYKNEDMNTSESYNTNTNMYADMMIDRFVEVFKDLIKGVPKTKSAIVESVNQDGTVNVKLPAEEGKVYSNIQNQSIFQELVPGDGVELFLKDGTFSNCWIIAKHNKMN